MFEREPKGGNSDCVEVGVAAGIDDPLSLHRGGAGAI
jgi:hypothetical protein